MIRACWLIASLALLSTSGFAAETCHTFESQYATVRTCVSSMLAPQAGNTYGPEHLIGTTEGATWCEGVPGPGIGQTIIVHYKPRQTVATINFTNGYDKTDETFRNNGRVKRALIATDGGTKKTITVKDTRESQKIKIPKQKLAWVKLTILEVYGGVRHADTCVSFFGSNLEEFALN